MTLDNAMKCFGYKYKNEIKTEDVKRRYKILIKAYHPDKGGNEIIAQNIIASYELLIKYADSIEKSSHSNSRKTCIIRIEDLMSIYNGDSIEYNDNGTLININKSNFRSYNIIISLEVLIRVIGKEFQFKELCQFNDNGEYKITCKIDDSKLMKTNTVSIIVNNRELTVDMQKYKTNINISFQNFITIVVSVERMQKIGY